MVKKIFIALIFFVALANFSATSANDKLDAADIRLTCAICSMGVYSDNDSYLGADGKLKQIKNISSSLIK